MGFESMKKSLIAVPVLFCLCLMGAEKVPFRVRTHSEAVKILESSKDSFRRKAAYRFLLRDKNSPEQWMKKAMRDSDASVRIYGAYLYYEKHKDNAFKELERLASDPDKEVRRRVMQFARAFRDRQKTAAVFRKALAKTRFPFYREKMRLKDNPTHDYDVVCIREIFLPDRNWDFILNPKDDGHKRGYYKKDFDSSSWKKVRLTHWEKQGFANYNGVAYYRVKFKMPAKTECNAVELHFGAVDESAWVWLNGIYVGQHDVGAGGWDKSFALDITEEIQWGKENVLTVRVLDREFGGGIWKKVSVQLIK